MREISKWWLLFSMLPWCLNVKCYKRLKYYFHHHQTSLTCLERELYCTLLSFPCPLHLNCLRCILGMSQVSGFYKMRFVFKPGFHLSYETFIQVDNISISNFVYLSICELSIYLLREVVWFLKVNKTDLSSLLERESHGSYWYFELWSLVLWNENFFLNWSFWSSLMGLSWLPEGRAPQSSMWW